MTTSLTTCTTLVFLCLGLPLAASSRKTVFLDRMAGLESYIVKAAAQAELPVEFLEEAEHPDLKVLLGNKFSSVHAEVLYRKNTGRTENTTLEVVDVKTRKTILTYGFQWTVDEGAKKRVAGEFVKRLKQKLNEVKLK